MTGILQNYLPLVVFIGVASLIGLVLLIAPFIVALKLTGAAREGVAEPSKTAPAAPPTQ